MKSIKLMFGRRKFVAALQLQRPNQKENPSAHANETKKMR